MAEVNRREFLKKVALVGTAAILTACAPTETLKQVGRVITPPSEREKKGNYWKGEVNEGEGLTDAMERISESKIGEYGNFGMIWEHDGVDYIFENRISFDNQDIVPLPVVWPQDKIVFGSREDMSEDMSERAKLPTQKRVFLEAKNNTRDDGVEKTITVLGGRFDRPVIFKLNDDRTFWEVNPVKDEWVKSDRLKEIMENNPDMKSSEALPQLLN